MVRNCIQDVNLMATHTFDYTCANYFMYNINTIAIYCSQKGKKYFSFCRGLTLIKILTNQKDLPMALWHYGIILSCDNMWHEINNYWWWSWFKFSWWTPIYLSYSIISKSTSPFKTKFWIMLISVCLHR